MTKAELVEKIQAEHATELSRKGVSELLDAVFAEIAASVRKSGRFSYPGFGTFTMKKCQPRVGRNPQTGAEIRIPATNTVSFKPAPDLKNSL